LRRTDLADTWNPTMADFGPTGNPGFSSLYSSIMNFASINNGSNGYWSFFRLPASANVRGKSLLIYYSLGSGPNPMETISIPAAAFTPVTNAQDYENHGRYLKHFGGSTYQYLAPVYAPHGAYLRRMIFYYNQIGATTDRVTLYAYEYAGYPGGGIINTVFSDGLGYQSGSASLYNYKVDNINERLYLELALTANNIWPCGVVIEYSRYASLLFLPTVQKN